MNKKNIIIGVGMVGVLIIGILIGSARTSGIPIGVPLDEVIIDPNTVIIIEDNGVPDRNFIPVRKETTRVEVEYTSLDGEGDNLNSLIQERARLIRELTAVDTELLEQSTFMTDLDNALPTR